MQGLLQFCSLKITASPAVERFAAFPDLLIERRVVSSSVSSFNLQTTGVMSLDSNATDAMLNLLEPLNGLLPPREKRRPFLFPALFRLF